MKAQVQGSMAFARNHHRSAGILRRVGAISQAYFSGSRTDVLESGADGDQSFGGGASASSSASKRSIAPSVRCPKLV
ncbi:hypothetical protein BH09MYX1_BH09MYX1_02940 [soil metagenome]